MTSPLDRPDDATDSPWMQPKFIVSAGVVAIVAVLGVLVAALGPGSNDPQAPPTSAPPSTATGSAPGSDSFCGLPVGSQVVPRVAPADTRWQLVGTMAAPTAPSAHGPGSNTDGIPTCFAHSPTGALYAAANFVATSSKPDAAELLVQVAATGPGQDAARQQAQETATDARADASAQLAGFNVVSYSASNATVDLLYRGSSGNAAGYAHFLAPLVWEDGTWKWSIPPSGNPYENTQAVPSPAGYVPWSGT